MATFIDTDFDLPRVPNFQSSTFAFTTLNTHAGDANDRSAFVFQVPKTGTLRRAIFRTGTVTAADDVRISFQGVDATAQPDGTEDEFRSIAAASIVANSYIVPGIMSSDGTDTGTKRSVVQGELLAVSIRVETFVDANFQIVVAQYQATTEGGITQAPYALSSSNAGVAWTKTERCSCLVLEYDDGTYAVLDPLGIVPYHAFNVQTFNSGSTPDERGMIFTPTFTLKVRGIWYKTSSAAAHDVVLYTGTTVTETLTLDPDYRGSTTSNIRRVLFANELTLTAGTTYRITVKPTSGSNITLVDWDVAAAGYFDAMAGGQALHYTERTDGGAFTETTTKRLFMGLMVSAVQTDAGTAAGIQIMTQCPALISRSGAVGY